MYFYSTNACNFENMKIRVVSAIGGGQPIDVEIEMQDTVSKLKQKIAQQRNIPPGLIIIVYRGKQLDDAMTIKATEMEDGDNCYLIPRTEGGQL